MEISSSMFNSGLAGLQAGLRRTDQAAGEIAGQAVERPTPGPAVEGPRQGEARPELADSLVRLMQGRNEVHASAQVVETADEVLGTLIDTRA